MKKNLQVLALVFLLVILVAVPALAILNCLLTQTLANAIHRYDDSLVGVGIDGPTYSNYILTQSIAQMHTVDNDLISINSYKGTSEAHTRIYGPTGYCDVWVYPDPDPTTVRYYILMGNTQCGYTSVKCYQSNFEGQVEEVLRYTFRAKLNGLVKESWIWLSMKQLIAVLQMNGIM